MKVDDKVGGVLKVADANAATRFDAGVSKWDTICVLMRADF